MYDVLKRDGLWFVIDADGYDISNGDETKADATKRAKQYWSEMQIDGSIRDHRE